MKQYMVTFHYSWEVEAEDEEQAEEQAAREIEDLFDQNPKVHMVRDMAATVEEIEVGE